MNKTTWLSFIALLLLATQLVLSSCGQEPTNPSPDPSPELITVQGRSVEALVVGDGQYTIVFENGLDETLNKWVSFNIIEEISRHNQVIAYNRPGYGLSQASTAPRSLEQITHELSELIAEVGNHEKVILVGYDWGGAIIRSFAVSYPEKTLALLLLEPDHEELNTILTIAQVDSVAQTMRFPGASDEMKQHLQNMEYLRQLPPLPQRPTTLLTSRYPVIDYELRFEMHHQLGTHLPAQTFKHETVIVGVSIPSESPTSVIQEIFTLMTKLR